MAKKDQKKLVSLPAGETSRPPIVVIMGHIDHGKSTLLDYIRKSKVVAGEAGGITQHIGAYQAIHTSADGIKHPITFLDTPGHEAFGGIRERGAKAADIAILVVSAEDGVKPQTLDAMRVIKEQNIPYIVAINKIDKPNADIDRTKQSLGENEIYVEGWGGDVPNVAISSIDGTGIPELMDMIILVSELAGLTANTDKPAHGLVIESELDARKGIKATLLIKDGTLKVGDFVTAGASYTPVRFIENFLGEKIDSAGPSMPVVIVGWDEIPAVGNSFLAMENRRDAEKLAEQNRSRAAQIQKEKPQVEQKVKIAPLPKGHGNQPEEVAPETATVPLILKSDVIGSLEGIKYELAKIKHDKVEIKIVSEGIGDINENDIKIALSDPNITVIGFHASPDKKAASMIERTGVNVKIYNIIYELVEFVRTALESKIPKEYVEETIGAARILATFSHEKDRQVIGGKVENGNIETGKEVKILRRNAEIGRGKIRELQTKKNRVSEVAEGHEFGMMLEAKIEIAVGDRIEAIRTVEKK
jgi:translation initiation factor IF-2